MNDVEDLNDIEIGEMREGEIRLIVSSGAGEKSVHLSFRWTTMSLVDLTSWTIKVWD